MEAVCCLLSCSPLREAILFLSLPWAATYSHRPHSSTSTTKTSCSLIVSTDTTVEGDTVGTCGGCEGEREAI